MASSQAYYPIDKQAFPDNFVPNSQKGKDYILEAAQAFHSQYENTSLFRYKAQMEINRLYAKGKQDTGKYREHLGEEDGQSFLNLDWDPVKVLPRVLDVALGMLMDINFEAQAKSIDPAGVDARIQAEHLLRGQLMLREELGNDAGFQADTAGMPQIPEDIEMYMMMDYKQAAEAAIEEGVNRVLKDMKWYPMMKSQLERNLFVEGICGTRTEVRNDGKLRFRKLNPVDIVVGHSTMPDYSDCPFFGEYRTYTISEIMQLPNADEYTKEELKDAYMDLAGNYNSMQRFGSYSDANVLDQYGGGYGNQEDYMSFKLQVLDFEFKTHNYKTYEKRTGPNGHVRMREKDADFKPSKDKKFKREKIQGAYETWYKGKWIIGTEIILDYGKTNFVARGNKAENEYGQAYSNFKIYCPSVVDGDFELSSHVERMIPFADGLTMAWYQFQNVIAQAVPKGFAIDDQSLLRAAEALDLEDPLELISFYKARGVIVYTNAPIEGTGLINQKPIVEMEGGLGKDFENYIRAMEHNHNMIRAVGGVSEAVDSTMPQARQAVGNTKIAAQGTINSLRPLVIGIRDIFLETCKCCAKKLQLIIYQAAIDGSELPRYIRSLGKTNVAALQTAAKFLDAEFDWDIDELPSQEQMALFQQDMAKAVEIGQITIADRMEIERVAKSNLKKAVAILKIRIQKREQAMQQVEQQKIQMTTEGQKQSALEAHQMKMEQLQIEAKIKEDIERVKGEEARKTLYMQMQLEGKQAQINAEKELDKVLLQEQMGMERDMVKGDIQIEVEKNKPKPQPASPASKKP